jgi:hypothetical protein
VILSREIALRRFGGSVLDPCMESEAGKEGGLWQWELTDGWAAGCLGFAAVKWLS